MSLSNLPGELLDKIFRNLDSSLDRAQASQTCQRLHDIIEPVLYSSFTHNDLESGPLFIRTILQRPHCAVYVKSFKFRWTTFTYQGDVELSPVSKILSGLKAEYLGVMERVWKNNDTRSQWVEDFQAAKCNAVTALVLSLLPNIEELVLWVGNKGFLTATEMVLEQRRYLPDCLTQVLHDLADQGRRDPKGPSGLQRSLRSVSIEDGDRLGTFIACFIPFFPFDGIKSFSLVGIRDHQPLETCHIFKPSLPLFGRLESLSLSNVATPSVKLVAFLSCFKSIKRLEYSHRGHWGERAFSEPTNPWFGSHLFTPGDFAQAIEHLQDCLEELVVLSDDIRFNTEAFEQLGSLQNFTKLRRIESTESLLLGRDKTSPDGFGENSLQRFYSANEFQESISKLPASLETLVIQDCRTDIYDWLAHLFENLESDNARFKSLRNIACVFLQPTRFLLHETSSARRDFPVRAQKFGIDLMIIMR